MQNTAYVPKERVMGAMGTMYDFEFLDFKFRTPSCCPSEYVRYRMRYVLF